MATLNHYQTWDLCEQGKKAWNIKIRAGGITRVTFDGNMFHFKCDFTGWYFPAKTDFRHINWAGALPEGGMIFKNAHFKEVEFSDIYINDGFISFENAIFNGQATFNSTSFKEANFNGATFNDPPILGNTTFNEASFRNTKFNKPVDFSQAGFSEKANFDKTIFKGQPTFSTLNFTEVSFDGATFNDPPILGNTTFNEASFRRAKFNKPVSFSQARFLGKTNFDGATFKGKSTFSTLNFTEVSFDGTTFNDPPILGNTTFNEASFRRAKFNKPVDFSQAGFSGKANFNKATFKGQPTFSTLNFTEVSFDGTTFNDPPILGNTTFNKASFRRAKFNKPVGFSQAEFSGKTNFNGAIFNESAHFSRTTFVGDVDFDGIEVKSDIDFSSCQFKGATNFTGAIFSQKTNFESAIFEGTTKFIRAVFGMENDFEYTTFKENTYFNGITASKAHLFSFRGATFGKTFSIKSNERIGCVIDFIDTQAKYSLHLGDIACTFRREHKCLTNRKWLSCILKCLLSGFQTPEDSDDISRLRKLKKVAQEEKDHLRALDYRVQEMQAKRWDDIAGEKTLPLLKSLKAFPEFVFWLLSDYGRSLFMPAFWLLSMTLLMGEVYYCLSSGDATTYHPPEQGISLDEPIDRWDAYGYSASQLFPWVPIARKEELLETENNNSVSVTKTSIKIFSFIQTLCATLLLFLFGLGARNRFLL